MQVLVLPKKSEPQVLSQQCTPRFHYAILQLSLDTDIFTPVYLNTICPPTESQIDGSSQSTEPVYKFTII